MYWVTIGISSYAYKTVKDRMPVILTKVIDFLCRNKGDLQDSHGEVCLPCYQTYFEKESLKSLQSVKILFCSVGSGRSENHNWEVVKT